MTRPAMACAWAWVLANEATIDRMAAKFAREACLERDEVRSEIVLRLVERHESYDPALSGASTWIWWSAREVTTRLLRARARFVPADEAGVADLGVESPGVRAVETRSTIRDLLARCTPGQEAAVWSVLDDLSPSEVEERLGVSVSTRNARLYRIPRTRSEQVGGAS
jgi:RNA polymerase sigma factor (sigma-70 family)